MADLVLDASVLIGFFDAGDANHHACVAGLRQAAEDDLLVPATVYVEILGPLRGGDDRLVDIFFERRGIEVVPITANLAREAARFRAVHGKGLSVPDVLVIAAAEERRCRYLTCDRAQAVVSELGQLVE